MFAGGGAAIAATSAASVPVHAAAVQDPGPAGNSGTTIDPLRYNCGNDAPTCGQVGESYGFYNDSASGTSSNVDLLYSENYFCDQGVSSNASTGCEVGAPPSANAKTDTSADGTSLGNTMSTTSTDGKPLVLYIPTPLFSPTPPTQCIATATCIDHPPTVDLSRIAGALGKSASSLYNVPVPAHDHVVLTRNSDQPAWWNVEVVPISSQASWDAFISSGGELTASQIANAVPSNIFLFFQVMPGTVPAAQAANLAATAPPGPALPAPAAAPPASQVEPGSGIDNLVNECGATAPNCENVGIGHDWIQGQDVDVLYTEQYFCDTSVSASSSSGCEAGAPANAVPPGVSDTTAPNQTAGVTNNQIDPLYIPVPLFANSPLYDQCPAAVTCIDQPATIDLSRLASALGVSNAASLDNVPLPGHDHLLTTRNGDQPEWWDVIVIPVTSQAGLNFIYSTKDYSKVAAMEGVSGSGIGKEIPTNAYLWFQTLPGSGPATPGPLSSSCMKTLPAGQVVGGAALDDGTGYIETDAKGDVAVFGGAACYGSTTGISLNKPIVGIATDKLTGGYWLVASDGGVFSFNAPFYGSMGGQPLNAPVVGGFNDNSYDGYWLVASDGGIFTFSPPGEGMPFFGSAPGDDANQ